ncbi:MAG: MG2 domain-containing protein, partial [Acidobacteriota bacterium]
MKGKFPLAVVVCLFLVSIASAQSFLKVNEAETQSFFLQNRLQTKLAIESSAANFPARIRLEILDADDKILAQNETNEIINRGKQFLSIPLEFIGKQDANNLLWYRLRYVITPGNADVSTSGVISLSEIMPEIFELQILASDKVFAGMRLRAHVVAVHPLTKKPIKNVNIAGEVTLDLNIDSTENKLKIIAKGKTNDEGFATLDFEIPQTAKLDDDGEIKIKGEKNGVMCEAEEDLDISAEAFVYLNLDKPIYQPNQKLFARGLYLNPLKHPLADEILEFEITDEEDETIYKQTAKTSRFGAANIARQIPANLKLGNYKLEVKNSNDDIIGASEFKVSRYDLPNFSVVAKPDKTFYLPEHKTAEITVSANYLFGKPVSAGKVRVVRETERIWNYNEQKYEIEEAQSYEGVLDEEGKFTAKIDLSEAHKKLAKDDWKRFEDLRFAAYFTNASTNRTEQKRFDVRVSKEAIHIYFLRYFEDVNPKLPFQFYVSTFYADGTPARCSLRVKGNYEEIKDEKILPEAKT